MEEPCDQREEENPATECNELKEENEDNEPSAEKKVTSNLDSLKQINCQVGTNNDAVETTPQPMLDKENRVSVLSKAKDTVTTGTKVKRKSRSTRRRLKAMVNNTSLHFSDTDSEGELTMINTQVRSLSPAKSESPYVQQGPVISVTLEKDAEEEETEENQNPKCLTSEDKEISRSGSFVENLTDVDELYPSETEAEEKENRNSLTIDESPLQAETELEDLEGDEEVQTAIYVKPRSDILCEFSGETIMTKEGDGPFSVEVRNKMSREEMANEKEARDKPDILILPNTDEEDMEVSDEEVVQEACCSQKEVLEDMDVLAASQIVMRNINKMENTLNLKETSDDVINDCHTDVEDVE